MKILNYSVLAGLFLIVAGCQKENSLSVSPDSVSLYCDSEIQLNATPDKKVIYASVDDYYASVSETGLVTAHKVGKTLILVESPYGSAKIPVTVVPKYILIENLDPYIGASPSTITANFGGNYKISTSNGNKTYTYLNPNSYVTGVYFVFENGKCSSIGLVAPVSSFKIATKYLIERYKDVGTLNDAYFFMNHDDNVIITFSLYDIDFLTITYKPMND